jgi:hypothetical protein
MVGTPTQPLPETRVCQRPIRLVLSALILLGAAACDSPFGLGDDRDDILRDNAARWARNGFASYDLVLQQLCFCGFVDSVRVQVRDGVKVGVEVAATGEPLPFNQVYPDVPGLFDIVEDAIDRAAHELDVQYHAVLGYPAEIAIDYRQNVADDEVTWRVSSLVRR